MEVIINYIESEGIKILLDFYITVVIILFLMSLLGLNSRMMKMSRQIFAILFFALLSIGWDLSVSRKFFEYFLEYFLVIIVVLFSPEIRQLLIGVSSSKNLKSKNTYENFFEIKKEVLDAVDILSINKIGALITFERSQSLDEFIHRSTSIIEASINSELLVSIFTLGTPLHDGGVILSNYKIKCAGAYYPSTDRDDLIKQLGSRHRAAIGMSEMNDSLTISVSEETGKVSVSLNGQLDYGIDRAKLDEYLEKNIDARKWW